MLALSVLTVGQTTSQASAATGFITDTLCGAVGATANHIEHAKQTVASGKAKYAIYDEKAKKLYILTCAAPTGPGEAPDDAGCFTSYLGQRVTVTGTLSATPVKRAGQRFDHTSQKVVSHTPRAGAPLDTSTPVAGILTISSIEPAPAPTRAP